MGITEDQEGRQSAQIKLEYTNLPTASLKRIDELLLNWARWHSETYVEGFVPHEVSSGAVLYSPDTMRVKASELTVLDDRPAAPNKSATQTMWFNVQYEQKADVPEYDRASVLTLTRKRCIDGDGIGDGDGDTGPRTGGGKRQRTGQRCFNCGSYGHSLRQCWKELDTERVDAERQSLGGGLRGIPRRYFLDEEERTDGRAGNTNGGESIHDPIEALRQEFPDAMPGKLSLMLRSALGIGEHEPPPWLHTMRRLGVPPAYTGITATEMVPPPLRNGAPSPKSHPLHLGPGDEEEDQDEEEGEVIPSPRAYPAPPPIDEIEHSNARPDRESDEELEDFMALPSEGALIEKDTTQDDAVKVELSTLNRVTAAVLFPGVNAPVPPEGDPAAWEDKTVQIEHWSGGNGSSQVPQPYYPQQQYAQPPPQMEHYAHQEPYGGYYHYHQQQYSYQPAPPGAPPPAHPQGAATWQQQWDPAQYPHHYAADIDGGLWGSVPPPPPEVAPPPPPPC